MKQNPTTAIKGKFSNEVHKLLEPNINVKRRERWQHRANYQLTDKQKIELFDKILAAHTECSNELVAYQFDKREKRRVQKERIARGYVPKKKITKEEYLKSTSVA